MKKGVVAVPSRFTVDTKNAGPGDLSVAVEGPSKVDIECVDNGDGTCEVTYVPVEPGIWVLSIVLFLFWYWRRVLTLSAGYQ